MAAHNPALLQSLRPQPGRRNRDGAKRVRSRRAAAICLAILSGLALFLSACHRRPSPPGPYLAFVVNSQSATLAAVDLARLRLAASLPVAPGSERVLVRPQSRDLWVVSNSGGVTVVEFPALRTVATPRLGRAIEDFAFSPDGRQAYFLDPAQEEIVYLDCDSGKELVRQRLGVPLSGLVLTPDGKTLVAAAASSHRLYFVSVESRKNLGSVEVGKSPGHMAVLPDSSKVFVADTEEGKISAADIATARLLSNLEIKSRAGALVVKPDGGEIFALNTEGAIMTIIDAFHVNVEQTFPTGRDPAAGVFRRNSSVVYIANAGDGSVMALDVQTRTLLASTRVGTEPRALALTPDERFLVVADSAASSLAVLRADPASLTGEKSALVTTIPVGSRPVDVVVPDWVWK